MKLNLKKVGEITHMEAEGTPEEIAAFVALLNPKQTAITGAAVAMHPGITVKINGGEDPALTGVRVEEAMRRSLTARPPQNGVGSIAFER